MPPALTNGKPQLAKELTSWLRREGYRVFDDKRAWPSNIDDTYHLDLLSRSVNDRGEEVMCGYLIIGNYQELKARYSAISDLKSRLRDLTLFIVSVDGAVVPEKIPKHVNLMVRQYGGAFERIFFDRLGSERSRDRHQAAL